jgi:hypothetical protein
MRKIRCIGILKLQKTIRNILILAHFTHHAFEKYKRGVLHANNGNAMAHPMKYGNEKKFNNGEVGY